MIKELCQSSIIYLIVAFNFKHVIVITTESYPLKGKQGNTFKDKETSESLLGQWTEVR